MLKIYIENWWLENKIEPKYVEMDWIKMLQGSYINNIYYKFIIKLEIKCFKLTCLEIKSTVVSFIFGLILLEIKNEQK